MGATPFSVVKKNTALAPAQKSPEQVRDEQVEKEERERAEKERATAVITDKVARLLADPVFITDYTWPSLYVKTPAGGMKQLFVSQFFPQKAVAVDKFYDYDVPKWELEAKRAELKRLDIRYVALFPDTRLADVAASLGV